MDPISGGALALSLLKRFWLPALLLSLLVVQTVKLDGFLWIKGANDKLEDCETNRKELRAERDSLIAAQGEAKRLNEQQVQRIVSEQDRISKDVEADLTARLERLRSELRSKAAPRNPGGPKAGPDVPSPEGADGEAGLCLTPEELLQGATNEEKHDQLITLLEKQGLVVR